MSSPPAGWHTVGSRARERLSTAALRHSVLWASGLGPVRQVVTRSPLTRRLVRRFVAGESLDDAIAAVHGLAAHGLGASVECLGEDTRDLTAAREVASAYIALVRRLGEEGVAPAAEVSVKLSGLGQRIDDAEALASAREVCAVAAGCGIGVTLDMEDHTTTTSTLRVAERLRAGFPSLGAVVQASLRRSVEDCRALAHPGSRVRLCKGAYQEPPSLAWQGRDEIRVAFLRCLGVLLRGGAYPMVATHDPRLIDAARRLTAAAGCGPGDHEHQMLYGVRPDEQLRLAAEGTAVRIYVPFGQQWYPYLMRRIAERPANLSLVLRSLSSRR